MDEDKIARYTIRISRELLNKVGYIAEYNGRTKNKELEQMIKFRIKSFEDKMGEIRIEEKES